jgi:ABC-type multidrug transport system permease subunit
MRQRWLRVAVLALVLFAVNVVARVITRLAFSGNDTAENRASIVMFAVIGVVLVAYTFVRAQRVPPSSWLPDIAASAVAGMLLTILVGPFISGSTPFADGAGSFFSQVWLYGGFAIVGTLLGYWIATALGRDYRSRSLKAYATARVSKPHRVVRR